MDTLKSPRSFLATWKIVLIFIILTSALYTFVIFLPSNEERHLRMSERDCHTTCTWRSFLERQLNVAEANWNRGRKRMEKIANRIQNDGENSVTLWDLLYPSFACPFTVERLGRTGDGGKWVCGFEEHLSTKSPCLIYSFGISGETSFEEEILQRSSNCTVRMFDHTIKGPPSLVRKYPGRAFWYPFGISGDDHTGKLLTLKTLMDNNQDQFIDILKMDVEGSEFKALERILQDFTAGPLPCSQLLVEIHLPGPATGKPKTLLAFAKSLEDAGLRAFQSELNFVHSIQVGDLRLSEFAFLNIKAEPFKLSRTH